MKFQIYKEFIKRFLTIHASDNKSKILDTFFKLSINVFCITEQELFTRML